MQYYASGINVFFSTDSKIEHFSAKLKEKRI